MEDIVDRLESVTRDFPEALMIGAGEGASLLTPACGVGSIMHLDDTPTRLPSAGLRIVAESEHLPVAGRQFDLVVSMLNLHAVNDVVGALVQARNALRPDGLFLGAAFCDPTLAHWRTSLRDAEIAATGRLAPRVAPFASVRDFGDALSRAGFAMPVADCDAINIQYREPGRLVADLRTMGETAILRQTAPLSRDIAARAMAIFAANGGAETFSIAYLTGWAPAPTQPKPLAPGSAKASLERAVKGSS